MEVKRGYKQTEAGVIPEDWDVKQLGDTISKVIDNRGKTPPYSNNSDIELIETVSISFVNQHPDYSKVSKFVSEAAHKTWFRGHPQKGDVLVSTVGEYSGASAIMGESRGTIAQNLIALRISGMDPTYFFYWTRSAAYKRRLSQVMMNQAQPSLRVPWLLSFSLSFPQNRTEQEAIAEALSDADALIDSLEQLIAKKRLLKQGAMQELLTGKKRLPGFAREWERKRLGDIAEIIMGQSPSSAHYNKKGEGLPLIQGNADIFDRKAIKRVFTTEVTKLGLGGDVLMSVRAPVGEISRAGFDMCLGRGMCAIRYPNNFVYHALIVKEPAWIEFSKGSTFDSVNSTDVKNFTLEMPKDAKEQIAIATILSDMGSEISSLEAKLSKARQIKQGMMQELLTGRIRLL